MLTLMLTVLHLLNAQHSTLDTCSAPLLHSPILYGSQPVPHFKTSPAIPLFLVLIVQTNVNPLSHIMY